MKPQAPGQLAEGIQCQTSSQGSFKRTAPLFNRLIEPSLPNSPEKEFRVRLVERGELWIQTCLDGSFLQQRHGERVDGRDGGRLQIVKGDRCPGPLNTREARQFFESLSKPDFHFAGGFLSKGDGGDVAQARGRTLRSILQDEIKNPIDQDRGLAGAGRGFDGKGSTRLRGCSGPLLRVVSHLSGSEIPQVCPIRLWLSTAGSDAFRSSRRIRSLEHTER